jgi:flagellin
MSTINTNVASLTAQTSLAQSQSQLNTSLQRLSTGLRINSGADDPAGLIASEGLKSEIAGINSAIGNSTQATNVISTADAALGQVSDLLLDIKGLLVQSANAGALTPDQLAANQLQIDSAVQSITRISNTTTFAGLNLLNGSLNYVTSGVNNSAIQALQIDQASFGQASTIPVQVDVLTSAKPAELQFQASAITKSTTLNIAGASGTTTLSFVSGTTASAIAFAVNRVADTTGVTATLINSANANSGITFESTGFGSANFVSVSALAGGTFQTEDTKGDQVSRTTGVDAVATINGALTVGNGLDLHVDNASLDLTLTLGKTFGLGKTSFDITGGGALFQLGSKVQSNEQVDIGIQSVAASELGDEDTGYLSDVVTGGSATVTGGQAETAEQIVELAISQVSNLRGKLGAFESNTLSTNVDSLNAALINVTSSESTISDANFAAETANLTRDQILVQAGTSVLATANSTPKNILSLLQQS